MRKRQEWVARRIATAKARRALPPCKTPGCNGKATGIAWGSLLCAKCKWGEKVEERKAKAPAAAPRET